MVSGVSLKRLALQAAHEEHDFPDLLVGHAPFPRGPWSQETGCEDPFGAIPEPSMPYLAVRKMDRSRWPNL